jgi:uncharacterized delta-60 repeat protein
MKNKTHVKIVLTILTIFLALPIISLAQAGSLDLSFDTDGKVITNLGADDCANSIVIQSDGKILVSGYYDNNVYDGFALCRYNTNGSLDNTFGFNGKVTTDFGSSSAYGNSVTVQSDGKILVAGSRYIGTVRKITLIRYNIDGSLDNTFDTDGKVTTSIGAFNDDGNSVAIQSDGRILVAGSSFNDTVYNFALVRYNNDGSLDTTFDTDGKVTTSTSFGVNNYGHSLAIQSDTKIVVAGVGTTGSGFPFFALARYNVDGSLDSTFDTDGKVASMFAVGSYGLSVALQSDGKILVAGFNNTGSDHHFALARYNTNGSLDSTFDMDGIVTTLIMSNCEARSVTVQSDGKIMVTGYSNTGNNYDITLARYNQNGGLDSTYDGDGIVTTDIGGTIDLAYSMAIQSDGKIVVAGSVGPSLSRHFVVARYNNDYISAIPDESCIQSLIAQIYPNPFSTSTTIQSEIAFYDASCIMYNMYGQKVREIDHLFGQIFTLKRDNLPSGVYIVQLTQDNRNISRSKIVLTD